MWHTSARRGRSGRAACCGAGVGDGHGAANGAARALQHQRCFEVAPGGGTFTDDEFKGSIETDTGVRPSWAAEAFADPVADVRQSLARLDASPFLPHQDARGFVYDVHTGALSEVPRLP